MKYKVGDIVRLRKDPTNESWMNESWIYDRTSARIYDINYDKDKNSFDRIIYRVIFSDNKTGAVTEKWIYHTDCPEYFKEF